MKIDPTGKYIVYDMWELKEVQVLEINHDKTSKELGPIIFRFEIGCEIGQIVISPDWRCLLVLTAFGWMNIYDISDLRSLSQTPAYRIKKNIGSPIREVRFHESNQAILIRRDHMIQLSQIDFTDKTEIAFVPISQYTFRKKSYSQEFASMDPNQTRNNVVEIEDKVSSVFVSRLEKTEDSEPFIIVGSRYGSLTVVEEMDTDRMTSIITPACVLGGDGFIQEVHIGKNHENVFLQTDLDILVFRMQDLPSNEPYAWLKNCGEYP
jgi:hypothetical protein